MTTHGDGGEGNGPPMTTHATKAQQPHQETLPIEHPAELPIEARAQTQHKLELLDRYYKSWCGILTNAHGHGFCVSDLWIVDAHAGRGSHLSEADPDGEVSGTPLLAARAARLAQRSCPSTRIHVRAIEIDDVRADELEVRLAKYKGAPPAGVDVCVLRGSFEDRAPEIQAEIAAAGHPHSEGRAGAHHHRSLWFLDPYGWEEIPYRVIAALGSEAEVVVNADIGGLKRLVGGANSDGQSAPRDTEILDAAFGDDIVEVAMDCRPWAYLAGAAPKSAAQAYSDRFPTYRHRQVLALRCSPSQNRWIVQLAGSASALTTLARDHSTALRAGTIVAGEILTGAQRNKQAKTLWGKYKGETLTVDEMFEMGVGLSRNQIRTTCGAAEEAGYGTFTAANGTMEWFTERLAQPGLTLGLA
jgi:three-Cys-motif partner protein